MSRSFWPVRLRQNYRVSRGTRTRGTESRGFTLIEMLVAFAVFSMAMAALVGGLYSGVRSWRTVTAHQLRRMELEKAFAQFRTDFRNLCSPSEDQPAILESSKEDGSDTVTLCTLGTRFRQRAGLDPVWRRVEYALRKRPEGPEIDLVRTETPFVGSQAFADADTEGVLLPQVQKFSVSYLSKDGLTDAWEDAKQIPKGVQIEIQGEAGRVSRFSIPIPCGLLSGR